MFLIKRTKNIILSYVKKFNRKELEEFRDKIEHYGSTMEKMGLTPVSGRVYAYLLFSKEPGATFEDLTSYLGVSKSAVSNALKYLTSVKMADSKTIGGARKRYFFISFQSVLNEEFMTDKFRTFAEMLDSIYTLRNSSDLFGKEIHNAALLYKMLIVELPIIIDRWKRTIALNEKQ